MTTTDPFSNPAPPQRAHPGDRTDTDPFGLPSDSGRAIRTGDAEDRAQVPKNHYGQYLLPQLDGTRPANNKGHRRVSTTKELLSNTIGIQKWHGRRMVEAFGMDPRVVEAAMRANALPEGPEREKAFGRIADTAFKIGGGKERAGLGTEFHELAELKWRGELNLEGVDPKWMPDLAALDQLVLDNDIQILPEYLERSVLCPYNQAGTFDNILRIWNPITEEYELVIGDIKTGRSLDLGWLEILIQLWSYANAYALWTTTKVIRNDAKDPAKITDIEGYYEDLPRELRTDKAVILHVPLDGTATLYVLDLSGVERYVKAAVEAGRANREAKLKVTQVATVRPDAFRAPEAFATPPAPVQETKSFVQLDEAFAQPVRTEQGPNGETLAYQTTGPATVPSDDPTDYIQLTKTDGPAPTPDQLAQEAKAAERLAAGQVALARAAENDQMRADKAGFSEPSTGPLKPLDLAPLAGKGQRGCGVCHRVGHKRGSTKCLGDADPGLAKPSDEQILASTEPNEYVQEPASMVISPEGPPSGVYGTETGSAPDAARQEASPFCLRLDGHLCQWTGVAGQWVCSVTGKPRKEAWEVGQTRITGQPPAYGHPDGESIALPLASQNVNAAVTEATAQEQAATGVPVAWPPPLVQPDPVLIAIRNASTAVDVAQIRYKAGLAGTWDMAMHEQVAMDRYRELGGT